MTRRSDRTLKKVTIRVWEDDWAALEEISHFQDAEVNRLAREMFHTFITQSRALAQRNMDRLPPPPAFSMDELDEATLDV